MAVNAVVSIQDEAWRLMEVAEKIGRMRQMPDWEVDPSIFKHVIAARNSASITTTGDSQITTYAVPNNMDFILTFITLRMNIQANATVNIISDEVGVTGAGSTVFATARLQKSSTNFTVPGVSYLALANRPVLFLFNSQDVISLIVNLAQVISGMVVAGSLAGFLVPTGRGISSRFSGMQTTIVNTTSQIIGGGAGGTGASGPGNQQAGSNTPF